MSTKETEKYSTAVVEKIEARQLQKLKAKYGLDYEKEIENLHPSREELLAFIDRDLDREFGQDTSDEKLDIEIETKNELIADIPNLTRFESPEHRRLLLTTEKTFLSLMEDDEVVQLPYCAVLPSDEVEAEIIPYEDLDRPIIYFHSGLFIANLLFSKLYAQTLMVLDIEGDEEKKNREAPIALCAVYFYNCYYSKISKSAPSYQLKQNSEKMILFYLLESIALFIYSHEYAHAHFNHFKDEDKKTVEQIQNDEFHADLFAVPRIVALYRKNKSPFALVGPIVFFRYLILLEKYQPAMRDIQTHPSSAQRLEYYFMHLENFMNDNERADMEVALTLEHLTFERLYEMFEGMSKVKIPPNES